MSTFIEVRVREQAVGQVERKRVVVVDDDRDTRDVLAELFVLLGHDVVGVADGRTAIAACLERPPDVMFIDIELPDMSGYDVASRLRSSPLLVPPLLVALTGRSQPTTNITRSFIAGMDLHVVKPVGIYVLRTIVGDAVRGLRPTRWPEGSGKWTPADLGLHER